MTWAELNAALGTRIILIDGDVAIDIHGRSYNLRAVLREVQQ